MRDSIVSRLTTLVDFSRARDTAQKRAGSAATGARDAAGSASGNMRGRRFPD
ncbi:MAG: hypothetical protein NVS9B10_03190 [Nevskia sp.]